MGNEWTGKLQQIKKAIEALDPNDGPRIRTVFHYFECKTGVEFPFMDSKYKRDPKGTIEKCLKLCAQSKECEDQICLRLGITTEDDDRKERQTKASEKAADAAVDSARSARRSRIAAWVSAVAAILAVVAAILALGFSIWTWSQTQP